jgi:hypothetical protein
MVQDVADGRQIAAVLMCVMVATLVMVIMMRIGRIGFMAVDRHSRFLRADAAAIYRFKGERRAEIEGRGGFGEERGRDAGIDQGAEEHIAADAGEAFEIADTHDELLDEDIGVAVPGDWWRFALRNTPTLGFA